MNINLNPNLNLPTISRKEKKRLYDKCRYLQKRKDPAFRKLHSIKSQLYQQKLSLEQKLKRSLRRKLYNQCHPDIVAKRKRYIKQYYILHADTIKRRSKLHRLKKYRMTELDYHNLFIKQNGKCAICGRSPNIKALAIDHDHTCCPTGKSCGKCIRGLLCDVCNKYLGYINDSPLILQKIINYIKKETYQWQPATSPN